MQWALKCIFIQIHFETVTQPEMQFIKTCFKIHFKTMTQSTGIRCALKGQSLYLHFIQLLLLVSSMTQARCESLKPCTRLFWLREVRGNNYLSCRKSEIMEAIAKSCCCLFVAQMWRILVWCQLLSGATNRENVIFWHQCETRETDAGMNVIVTNVKRFWTAKNRI